MFNFIKNSLQKIYQQFTAKISSFFTNKVIDAKALKELEILLLSSDVGVSTTNQLLAAVQQQHINTGEELYHLLRTQLIDILQKQSYQETNTIFLLVGINGSGKTTFAAKLANHFKKQGKKVLLVAADTFRAAATEQLNHWAQILNIDIQLGQAGQDPAAVVFNGCSRFINEKYDILIIDTAGRLQTKINLMNELAKIKRILATKLPSYSITTFLTIDAMLGQNSLEQARLFKECSDLQGIVLTKMDGSAKGGIVFAISQELEVPIAYITFGEQPDQIKFFNAVEYVEELLGEL